MRKFGIHEKVWRSGVWRSGAWPRAQTPKTKFWEGANFLFKFFATSVISDLKYAKSNILQHGEVWRS